MVKYKLKDFAKWAKKQRIGDWVLINTIEEMNNGLLGDRIGSFIFKKRIGIGGKGKRGGARTIICFKKDELAVFLYGYAKNEQVDISLSDVEMLREFAKGLLELSKSDLEKREQEGKLIKIEEIN